MKIETIIFVNIVKTTFNIFLKISYKHIISKQIMKRM